MLYCTSSVDEVSRQALAPYESLTGDESYQSRDLEKVANLVEFEYKSNLNACLVQRWRKLILIKIDFKVKWFIFRYIHMKWVEQ